MAMMPELFVISVFYAALGSYLTIIARPAARPAEQRPARPRGELPRRSHYVREVMLAKLAELAN
jgi:hypothetical protein